MSIKAKILILILFFVLIPTSAISYFAIDFYKNVITQEHDKKLDADALTLGLINSLNEKRLEALTNQIALDNSFQKTLKENNTQLLEKMLSLYLENHNLSYIVLYNENIDYLTSVNTIQKVFGEYNAKERFLITEHGLEQNHLSPIYFKEELVGIVKVGVVLAGKDLNIHYDLSNSLRNKFSDYIVFAKESQREQHIELLGKMPKNIIWSKNLVFKTNDAQYNYRQVALGEDVYLYLADNQAVLNQRVLFFRNEVVFMSLIVFIIGAFIAIRLANNVVGNIVKLTDACERIQSGDLSKEINVHSNDEINILAYTMNSMKDSLKRYKRDMQEQQEEIRAINKSLEAKIDDALELRMEEEKTLLQQRKMATMGDMIGNMAYEWRQPLNEITHKIEEIKEQSQNKSIETKSVAVLKQLHYMTSTIDDFHDFFLPVRAQIEFDLLSVVNETFKIANAQLRNYKIDVFVSGDTFIVYGEIDAFKQVLLNMITNAKDAITKHANKGNIIIDINASKRLLSIEDSGGGIHATPIESVFKPYYSTHANSQSIGIDLYMSRLIIEEKLGGKIWVENIREGARFNIMLPKQES